MKEVKNIVTERMFYLITDYAKIHPELSNGQIGVDCGGWSDACVRKVKSCGGSWELWEKKKEEHKEKYKRGYAPKSKTGEAVEKPTDASEWQKWYDGTVMQMAKDLDRIKIGIDRLNIIASALLDVWKGN